MSTLTSSLIVSLIDRVTAPSRAIASTINRLTAASTANAARMAAMQSRMIGAAGAGYALYRGLSAPINAAMEFESAMADVRKVVDFPTPDGFKKMGLDIRAMALETPLAADGIAAIVAAAGQSGIANADLLGFAQMASKISVAWDTSAGETGEALAKLKTALGLTIADTGSLADAINHLGNKSAASAPDILEVVKRVAPMAKQFGLTAEQAAAFGAAMVGSGFEAQVASTSFLNMGRALTKGSSATDRQSEAFGKLGLSAVDVAKSMQKDATGTIMDVLARLREVPAAMRAAMISDLFGDEARAIGPLINNANLLADTLGLVGDKTKYAGSAQAEFEERSRTTENAIQLFKNRIVDLAISIGDALTPSINSFVAVVGPMITNISELAQRFPMVTNAIVGVTAAVIGFKVAAIAAQFAGLVLKGAFLDASIAALKAGRGIAGVVLAPAVASFNRLRSAVVGYNTAAATAGAGGGLRAMAGILLGLSSPARVAAQASVAQAAALMTQRQAAYQTALSLQALARQGKVAGLSFAAATANVKSAGAALVASQAGMKAANAGLLATGSSVGVVTRAFRVLRIAVIGTGIGAILVGIAAAGTWIYNNWSGISTMFEAFKGAFSRAMAPIMPAIQPVLDGFSWLWEAVSNLLGPIDEMGGGWASAGIAAGKFVGDTIVAIVGLPGKIIGIVAEMASAGAQIAQALWDGTKTKIDEMIAWFSGLPAWIVAAIGSIDIGSLIKWPTPPAWLSRLWGGGGATQAPAAPASATIAGTRAAGGPVRAGGSYLVGERGPELVTFGKSGMVHDALKTARMMRNAANAPQLSSSRYSGAPSQQGRGGGVNVSKIEIAVHASPGQSAGDVAQEVKRALSAELNALSRGAYSDGAN